MVCAKLILFYWRREELWFKPSQIQRTTVASGTIPLLFPLGVATVTILIILQRLCFICVLLCLQPLGLLSANGGPWIFNVRNDLSAYCTREG